MVIKANINDDLTQKVADVVFVGLEIFKPHTNEVDYEFYISLEKARQREEEINKAGFLSWADIA